MSSPPRRIALGADHAGYRLKEHLRERLEAEGYALEDLGTHDGTRCDYPDLAHAVVATLTRGEADAGLLVCGTGVGMAMAANRHGPAVRAVVCSDTFSAKMARAHNDANVLCIGERVVGVGLAEEIVRAFLATDFEGGRHADRVAKIDPPARR